MGYLEAYQLPYTSGSSPVWKAENKLKNKDADKRKIYTSTTGSNKVAWTLAQQANLQSSLRDFDGTSAVSDELAADIIEFHRGIDMPEKGYRDREGWRLGDIVDSSPVVVGDPSYFYDFNDYEAFRTANKGREELVFTASNDGMLHAFRTSNGQEYWAYIPRAVLPRLTELMDSDVLSQLLHQRDTQGQRRFRRRRLEDRVDLRSA